MIITSDLIFILLVNFIDIRNLNMFYRYEKVNAAAVVPPPGSKDKGVILK